MVVRYASDGDDGPEQATHGEGEGGFVEVEVVFEGDAKVADDEDA